MRFQSKPIEVPTVREVLRHSGFKWSKGKIYVPVTAEEGEARLRKISQTHECLEQKYIDFAEYFAIDDEHVFVAAMVTHTRFPLPLLLPVTIRRSSTDFLTLDLQDVFVITQAVFDEEGAFVGEGHIHLTPSMKHLQPSLFSSKREAGVHVAGVRPIGVYVAAQTQADALKLCVARTDDVAKQTAQGMFLFGNQEQREAALFAYVENQRSQTIQHESN